VEARNTAVRRNLYSDGQMDGERLERPTIIEYRNGKTMKMIKIKKDGK
jgi:hypothetical protein